MGGAYVALQTTVLHMKRLHQTEYPIFMILCVLYFQRQSFLIFILQYCSWCCAVWRPLKVSQYIIKVQVKFYFLWDHWALTGYFENRIPVKPALGGVCSLANYSVAYEETQSNRVSDFSWFCVFFVSKGNPFLLLFYSTVAGVVLCGGRKKSPFLLFVIDPMGSCSGLCLKCKTFISTNQIVWNVYKDENINTCTLIDRHYTEWYSHSHLPDLTVKCLVNSSTSQTLLKLKKRTMDCQLFNGLTYVE